MLIIWRGFGILVPVIAGVCFFIAAIMFGGLEHPVATLIGGLGSGAALWFLGSFLKNRDQRRHLYFIPMEIWGIIAGGLAIQGFVLSFVS